MISMTTCRQCGKSGPVEDEFTSPYTGLCADCARRAAELTVPDFIQFEPRDVICLPTETCGTRRWEVVGNYIGATRQENVVGLVPLDMTPSGECAGKEMLVPEHLLFAALRGGASLFRPVITAKRVDAILGI
jgi:hypothetical protein